MLKNGSSSPLGPNSFFSSGVRRRAALMGQVWSEGFGRGRRDSSMLVWSSNFLASQWHLMTSLMNNLRLAGNSASREQRSVTVAHLERHKSRNYASINTSAFHSTKSPAIQFITIMYAESSRGLPSFLLDEFASAKPTVEPHRILTERTAVC